MQGVRTDGTIACFGELLLRYGAPARELLLQSPRLEVHVGGAEANVAIGLASLGHASRMISRVPDDPLGGAALRHLRAYGVDTRAVATAPGRMGIYYLTQGAGLRGSEILYDRAYSSFGTATSADYHWDALLKDVGLLHLSGITPALGPDSAAVALAAVEAAKRLGVTISFDGNYRTQLWARWNSDPRSILSEIVAHATILFGNHRDISLLLNKDFDGAGPARRREAADEMFAAFPGLQSIASTARRVEDSDRHHISARLDTASDSFQTDEIALSGIVDRIGTGDAFAAGILHGVRRGLDAQATLDAGHALVCLKHSLPGDASLFGEADIAAFREQGFDIRR
jgi:2-dehydro-3-deoxygluconokinase